MAVVQAPLGGTATTNEDDEQPDSAGTLASYLKGGPEGAALALMQQQRGAVGACGGRRAGDGSSHAGREAARHRRSILGTCFCEQILFGDKKNPLLVSVRSGAKFSMPGMMDTILNLGLSLEVVEGFAQSTKNPLKSAKAC